MSCKDVTFSAANIPAMSFLGGGAKNYKEWFDFMGLVKDKRDPPAGSPFQIDFPDCPAPGGTLGALSLLPSDGVGGGRGTSLSSHPHLRGAGAGVGSDVPDACQGLVPLSGTPASCKEGRFRCSCGDCPDADTCAVPPAPGGTSHCCRIAGAPCTVAAAAATWLGVCAVVTWLAVGGSVGGVLKAAVPWRRQVDVHADLTQSLLASGLGQGGEAAGAGLLPPRAGGDIAGAPAGSRAQDFLADSSDNSEGDYAGGDRERAQKGPWPERRIRDCMAWLGHACSGRRWWVLGLAVVAVLVASTGMGRLVVETEPQRLWVGPDSRAAQFKVLGRGISVEGTCTWRPMHAAALRWAPVVSQVAARVMVTPLIFNISTLCRRDTRPLLGNSSEWSSSSCRQRRRLAQATHGVRTAEGAGARAGAETRAAPSQRGVRLPSLPTRLSRRGAVHGDADEHRWNGWGAISL